MATAYSPIAASSALSPCPAHRVSARLPLFAGLRIKPVSAARSAGRLVSQSSSRSRSRVGAVVCEAPDITVDVPPVTDSTWQSLVLDSETAVLVEFWAPWCGPCRMIHPVIDELAKQYAGNLKCYKVNTDDSPSVATRYGIRSIPTVIIFKGGEKKDAIIGAVPKSTLTSSIEKYL